jgi:predicted 2-oxoglutarate/Fe(II)-dependent dioxygenase YbiX
MSHLPLWYIGQLGDEMCDRIVTELSIEETKEATLGSDGSELNLQTRKTAVRFAPQNYWLEGIFERFITEANKHCGWEYHITGAERVQFAEYGESNHYTWHTDTFTLSGSPVDRKISVVCLLNDEFEGGEFEMRLYSDYTAPLKKGSMIAFPSILEHRVKPVTAGVRRSATMWFNGPRFR